MSRKSILILVLALCLPASAAGGAERSGILVHPRQKSDPPERFNLTFYAEDGGWGLAGGLPGPDDVVNFWPDGHYSIRLAEGNALFGVCPAGRGPECGTSSPQAVPFLWGWGSLVARGSGLDTGGGWCAGSARGHAILEDEFGARYDFSFVMVRFRNRDGSGCRTVHGEIEVTPIPE